MTVATRWKLFCAVSPGLEDVLAADLRAIPEAGGVRRVAGGCEVSVAPSGVWAVVLRSRVTESARVRIGSFRARTFSELERGIRKLPWAAWLPRGSAPDVRVACNKSKLWHSDAVEQRVRAQVTARLAWQDGHNPAAASTGADTTEAGSAARVYVRIDHDAVRVSIDASGELLHRRGERTSVGKAPMRETLAAAILRAADLGADTPLWDPFCGAGTLLLEAGRSAAGGLRPRERGYAFELWPSHDAEAYAAWLTHVAAQTIGAPRALFGCDIDPKEIAAAQLNLASAGLLDGCALRVCDFADMVAVVPQGASIVSNLPYGRRSPVGDTFRRFGRLLARRPDLDVWLLLGHPDHAQQMRIDTTPALKLRNGGLRVGLYHRAASPARNTSSAGR